MHTVTVAEAKSHLSEILHRVEAGEEVVITRRGQAIARIDSIAKPRKPLISLAEFRDSLPKTKLSSTKIIRKMREEGY